MSYRNKITHYTSLIMRNTKLKLILIFILVLQLPGCMSVDYKMKHSSADVRVTPPSSLDRSKYHVVRVQDAWKVIYLFGFAPLTPFNLDKMTLSGYIYKNNPGQYPVRGVKLMSGKTVLDVFVNCFTFHIIVPRTVSYDAFILEPKSSRRSDGIDKKRDAVQKTRSYLL